MTWGITFVCTRARTTLLVSSSSGYSDDDGGAAKYGNNTSLLCAFLYSLITSSHYTGCSFKDGGDMQGCAGRDGNRIQ